LPCGIIQHTGFSPKYERIFRPHGSRLRELTLLPSQHNGEPLPRFCDILYPLHQKHKNISSGCSDNHQGSRCRHKEVFPVLNADGIMLPQSPERFSSA